MNAKIAFSIIVVACCLGLRQQVGWSSGEAVNYFRSKLRPELNRIERELPRMDKGKLVNTRVVELFDNGKKRRELTFESTVEKNGSYALMVDRISTGAERYSLENPQYTATLEKFGNGNYGILDFSQTPFRWTFLKSAVDAAFRSIGDFSISAVFEQPYIHFVEGKEVDGRAVFKFDADPKHDENTSHVLSFVVEFDVGTQLPVKFDCVFRVPLSTGHEDLRSVFEYQWASFPEFGVIAPKTKMVTSFNANGFIRKKETSNIVALAIDQFEKEKCYTSFYGLNEPVQPSNRGFWWVAGLSASGVVLVLVSRFLMKRHR